MLTNHPFSIRAAADADAGSIAMLISQLGYPTLESEMTERLAKLRRDAHHMTLVAEIGSAVVGVVGVGLSAYYERNGVYARLLALAVDDTRRGQGVGRALVKAAEQWAIGQGANAIFVNSAHHRRDAHEFYERAGYRSTGVRFAKELERAI